MCQVEKSASQERLQSNAYIVGYHPFHLNTKWMEERSCSHTIKFYLMVSTFYSSRQWIYENYEKLEYDRNVWAN